MRVPVDGKGLFASLLTVPTWGITGVFVKLLPGLSPFFVTSARLLLAALVLGPVMLIVPDFRRGLLAAVRRPVAWWLAGLFVVYYITAVSAYQLAPVGEMALAMSISPAFSLLLERRRGLRPQRQECLGALVALLGVMVVVLPGLSTGGGTGWARVFGHALALTCSASAAVYTDGFRALEAKGASPDATAVSLLAFLLGGALLGGMVLGFEAGGIPRASSVNLPILLLLAVASTAIPTVAYGIASRRLPSVLTTTIRLLIPVFATVAAAVLLGERPSVWVLPGGLLVLGGILYMVTPSSYVRKRRDEAAGGPRDVK